MENEIGFKELYDVSLKATYPIEVDGETIEVGETIAHFDKIQLANFQEIKSFSKATGGQGNASLIWWEDTKEVKFNFSQGVFSMRQMSLMINAHLITSFGEEKLVLYKTEEWESDEDGNIFLTNKPIGKIFVYDKLTGKKVKELIISDKTINVQTPYKEFVINYEFEYSNGYQILELGHPLTRGTFSLQGKTRVKDGSTGVVRTGIINIPKLRLMSDLSMRLGSDAIPQVGRLDAVALPDGVKGKKRVMEIIFLNDDIDADM